MAKAENNFKEQTQRIEKQLQQLTAYLPEEETTLANLKNRIAKTINELQSLKASKLQKENEIDDLAQEEIDGKQEAETGIKTLEKLLKESESLPQAYEYQKKLRKEIEKQKEIKKSATDFLLEIEETKKNINLQLDQRFNTAIQNLTNSSENLAVECTAEILQDTLEKLEKYGEIVDQEIDKRELTNAQKKQKEAEESQKLLEEKDYVPSFSFTPTFNTSLKNQLLMESEYETVSNHPQVSIKLENLKEFPESHTEESDLQSRLDELTASKNSLAESLIVIKSQKTISEGDLVEEIKENQENIAKVQTDIVKKENTIKRLESQISASEKHLENIKTVKEFTESQLKQNNQSASSISFVENIITKLQETNLSFEDNTKNFLIDIEARKFTPQQFIKELSHYIDNQNKENDQRRNEIENSKRFLETNEKLLQVHSESADTKTRKTYEKLNQSLDDLIVKNKVAKDFLDNNQKRFDNKILMLKPIDQERAQLSLKIQALESLDTTLDEKIIETRDAITELNQLKNIEEKDYTAKIDKKAEIIHFPKEADYEDQARYSKAAPLASIADNFQSDSESLEKSYFQKNSPKETLKNLEETKADINRAIQQFKQITETFDKENSEIQEKIQNATGEIFNSEEKYKNELFKFNTLSKHINHLAKISQSANENYKKLIANYQTDLNKSTSIADAKKTHQEYAAQNQSEAEELVTEIKKISFQSGNNEQNEIESNLNIAISDAINNLMSHPEFGLHELHIELENYIKNTQLVKPTKSVVESLESAREQLECEAEEAENRVCGTIEENFKQIPSIAKLLDDSKQSLPTYGKARNRVSAKIATLNAINNRISHEIVETKQAQKDLEQYKVEIELNYQAQLSFTPDIQLPKRIDTRVTEEEKTKEITKEELEGKLTEKNLSLDYLHSNNKISYEKNLNKAKQAVIRFHEKYSIESEENSLAKKIEEKKANLSSNKGFRGKIGKTIEQDEFAIRVIQNHLEKVKKIVESYQKLPTAEIYKDKLGNDNSEIQAATTQEAVDIARGIVHEKSSLNVGEFLEKNRISALENARLKRHVDRDNANIVDLKSLETNFHLLENLKNLKTRQQTINQDNRTGINEYELAVEFEYYTQHLEERLKHLKEKNKKEKEQLSGCLEQIENLNSEIEEISREHWDKFQKAIAVRTELAGFIENNKDKIQSVIEEEGIPEHRTSAAAIEIFDKQLDEALKNLKNDPEFVAQEKQIEEYVSSRKAKKQFSNPNFEKWMHEVFVQCEWNFYQPEDKRRNTKPNAGNINSTTKDVTSSFSYGGASITLVENENGGHTITTDGFDILHPERGNLVALIYTHLLQMHHKQQFYSENIIAEKGEVSPEGKKRGFYLYRGEDNKVYALVVHDDKTNETLNLTEIATESLLEELDWSESGQKNTGDIPNKLLNLIIYNCKYEMQQGGINWANARHQNFLLDKPKLSDGEINEVLEIGLGDNNLNLNLFKTIPGFEKVSTIAEFREKVNFISEAEKLEPRPANIKKNPKSQPIYLQPEFIKKIIEDDLVDDYRNSGCNFLCIKNQLNTYIRDKGEHFPEAILEHVIKNEQVDIKTFLMTLLNEENNDDTAKNLAQRIAGSKKVAQALHEKNLLKPMLLELVKENKFTVAKELSAALSKIPKSKRDSSSVEITKHAREQFRAALKLKNKEAQEAYTNIVANCYDYSEFDVQREIGKKISKLKNPARPITISPDSLTEKLGAQKILDRFDATKRLTKTTSYQLLEMIKLLRPSTINTMENNGHVKALRGALPKADSKPSKSNFCTIRAKNSHYARFFKKHAPTHKAQQEESYGTINQPEAKKSSSPEYAFEQIQEGEHMLPVILPADLILEKPYSSPTRNKRRATPSVVTLFSEIGNEEKKPTTNQFQGYKTR